MGTGFERVEAEWYSLPDRGEVMVNVTDLYGGDLEKVLAEVGKEFEWTGVDWYTGTHDGVVEQWMYLLGATECSIGSKPMTLGSNVSERSNA